MTYFNNTVLLGSLGVVLALFAWYCSGVYASDPMHTKFFGTQIPMAIFGITGYLLIALSAAAVGNGWFGGQAQTVVAIANHVFVGFAAIFTVFLVWKAIQVRLFCPGCILCWMMNAFLAIRLVKHLLSAWQTQSV